MSTVRARCGVLGSVIGAADIAVAILLVQDPSIMKGLFVEMTLLVVLFAAIACWLLLVE